MITVYRTISRPISNLIVVLFLVFIVQVAYTQTPLVNSTAPTSAFKAIRPGALFLLIPADSRSAGMGNAGIATNPDVTAVFHNIAKLPFVNENISFHTTYTPWFVSTGAEGMFLLAAGGYYKKKNNAFSANIKYFQYMVSNEFDRSLTSTTGFNRTEIKPYELSLELGYSRKIAKGLALGITGRYVKSQLSAYNSVSTSSYKSSSAFLGDISLFYEKNINYKKYDKLYKDKNYYDFGYDKVYVGALITNVGTRFNYTDSADIGELPPTQFKIGVGYRKIINELNKLVLTAEFAKLLVPSVVDSISKSKIYSSSMFQNWSSSFNSENFVNSLSANIGAEFWYNDLLAFRLGYTHSLKVNGLTGLTGGVSVRFYVVSFDISYYLPISGKYSNTTFDPLANSIRFGATIYLK